MRVAPERFGGWCRGGAVIGISVFLDYTIGRVPFSVNFMPHDGTRARCQPSASEIATRPCATAGSMISRRRFLTRLYQMRDDGRSARVDNGAFRRWRACRESE